MPRPANANKPWTGADCARLLAGLKAGRANAQIAAALGRSPVATRSHARVHHGWSAAHRPNRPRDVEGG